MLHQLKCGEANFALLVEGDSRDVVGDVFENLSGIFSDVGEGILLVLRVDQDRGEAHLNGGKLLFRNDDIFIADAIADADGVFEFGHWGKVVGWGALPPFLPESCRFDFPLNMMSREKDFGECQAPRRRSASSR